MNSTSQRAKNQPFVSSFSCRPHVLERRASQILALLTFLLAVSLSAAAQVNVTTSRYDNQRSNVNGSETILTPSNVNSTSFGKLFSQTVDGYVYAQPLYVWKIAIPGKGTHNVVYVATEHDSVYAFDADSNAGANAQPLWHTSFLSSGVTTVPSDSAHLNTTDINPEVGITGTPVIDLGTNTIYVVAETLENSGTKYVKRLHALDVTTGAEKSGSPVVISASVSGTGQGSSGGTLDFDSRWENNRPGLLLYNGVVYIGFSSHGDNGDWHGWLLGYNTSNLQQVFTYCTTPNGLDAGIWMAGEGLSMDSGSNLFFATGNGTFDTNVNPPVDNGDSIVRIDLSQGPTVQDYFAPSNQNALDVDDQDLGSGGLLVLPDQPGANPHLLVQAGKQGNIYLLNRDAGKMGHFNSSSDAIVQELDSAIGGMWATPVYFNGRVYLWGSGDVLKAFSLLNGTLSTSPVASGGARFGFPGASPTISANGTSNAILWALQSDAYSNNGPGGAALLRAYDPGNLGNELYDSNMNTSRDNPGGAIKFAVPTVANGKVYAGSEGQLSVYGLLGSGSGGVSVQLSPGSSTLFASQSQQFTATVTGSSNVNVTWSLSPAIGTLSASGLYQAPSAIASAQTVTVTATSDADTTQSASATVSLQPGSSSFTPVLLDAGGSNYTDSIGQSWSADADFSGGNTGRTSSTISNTPDPTLYQTERYGSFSYNVPAPNGSYHVVLKFAEIYYTSTGQRIFNVAINGTQVLSNFDIVAAAGGPLTAIDKSFIVNVTTGAIDIQFIPGSADLPKVSAIHIVPASGVGIQANPTMANLTASQSQQFTANVSGTSNTNVAWVMRPVVGTLSSSGLYTAPSSVTKGEIIKIYATSLADTTQTSEATVNLDAPFSPIRVNAGGPAYTDSQNQIWSADTGSTGGNTSQTANAIHNTSDPVLYQTERYGNFSYQYIVPNGSYNVTLKFAEIYYTSPGQRIFNVAINGTQVLTNFDIVAAAGAALTAIDKTFPVTVTNGTLTIQFSQGSADLPKISAIQIVSASGSGVNVQVNPGTMTLSGSQSQQFTANLTGTSNPNVTWSMSPAVGTLSASGLYQAPSTITTAQTITITATSVAQPSASGTAAVKLQPSGSGGFTPILINAGGPTYMDAIGQRWSADADFSGGNTGRTSSTISNTPDPTLYQTERFGSFAYAVPVANGDYNVVLKFAETYYTSTGQRIFSVTINGTQVLTNFDIVAAAGGPLMAIDKSFPVTVTNGVINIQFIKGSADLPKVSAIEIAQSSGVSIQMTPTEVNLSAGENQQFTATITGTSNTAVAWVMSPSAGALSSSGLYTAPSSVTKSEIIKIYATSLADTTQTSEATVNLDAPFSPIRVNAGGPAYTDSQSQIWSADTGSTGGNTSQTANGIHNTSDPVLYQTERYGNFSYQYIVPNGSYNVTLKFAEIYYTSPGQRIFNVAINGTQVLTNFDIVAAAGAALTAIDKTFPVTVTNGTLTIQFSQGSADLPKISAIQILQ